MEGAGEGTADAPLLLVAAVAVGGVGGSDDDDDDGFSNLTMGGTTEATDGDAHGIETEDAEAEAAAAFAAAASSEGEGALDGGGVGSVWRRGAFNMADKPDDDDIDEVLGIGVLALLLFSATVEEADRLLVDDEVEG